VKRARSSLWTIGLGLALVPALPACTFPARIHRYVHPSLLGTPSRPLPGTALVVTNDVLVEGDPERTAESARLLAAGIAERAHVEVIEPPELSDAERSALAEHRKLAASLAGAAIGLVERTDIAWSQGEEWGRRLRRFEPTLGTGLAFLRERSGAEAIVVVEAVTQRVPHDLPWALGMLDDASGIRISVIDLGTGDLLWACRRMGRSNAFWRGTVDLSDPGDVEVSLDEAMGKYPNIEEYRARCPE
jgi:hypothetical protein